MIKKKEENFTNLYTALDNERNIYYCEPSYINYENTSVDDMAIESKAIYMNDTYYEKANFSFDRPVLKKDMVNVLVPQQYVRDINILLSDIELDISQINVITIDDDTSIEYVDYSTVTRNNGDVETFFTKTYNKIYIVGHPYEFFQRNPYYMSNVMDAFTGGYAYSSVSLDEMNALVHEYGLSDLVTPVSKIQPYEKDIDDIYYLYTIALYSSLFSAVVFIVMTFTSTSVIVTTKKNEIAVRYLHGKNINSIYYIPFIFYGIGVVGSWIILLTQNAQWYMYMFSCCIFFVTGAYAYLYARKYALKNIVSIVKGQ
ncbi:MAG: hypothetical protein J6M18_04135 [Actinomycetaceae bacterium]|nr:hypothetical protein [Actinomycetaceae bacterium]